MQPAFLTLNPSPAKRTLAHTLVHARGSARAPPPRPTRQQADHRPRQVREGRSSTKTKLICLTCSRSEEEGCAMRRHRCRCCMASGAGAPQRCCCCCSFGRRENGMQKAIEREQARCTREGARGAALQLYARAGGLSTERG
jgi:hypothetical protein